MLVSRLAMSAVVVMWLATWTHATPRPAEWKAAETVLRERLAVDKLEIVELTPKTGTTLGTTFWVRGKVGGKPVGKLVVVRGTTIFDAKGDDTITAILKADDQLTRHTITARDLLYLIQQLGTLPTPLGNVLTEYRDKRLLPKLTFGKTGATLVLHSFRQTHTPGDPATKTQPLVRATLKIAPDYTLAWHVELLDRPIK